MSTHPWGSAMPTAGRGARSAPDPDAPAHDGVVGRIEPPPTRDDAERTCPRCRHRWIEGPAPDEGTWPALALSHVAPILSVPHERMGLVQALVSSKGGRGTVGQVAAGLGISRRVLGRRLSLIGAPTPAHWVGLGRGMRAAEAMMRRATLKQAARDVGFPDQFQLSNHLDRHFGVWPTEAREAPDPVWRWLADRWLDRVQEAMSA